MTLVTRPAGPLAASIAVLLAVILSLTGCGGTRKAAPAYAPDAPNDVYLAFLHRGVVLELMPTGGSSWSYLMKSPSTELRVDAWIDVYPTDQDAINQQHDEALAKRLGGTKDVTKGAVGPTSEQRYANVIVAVYPGISHKQRRTIARAMASLRTIRRS